MAMRLLTGPQGKSRRDLDNAAQELRSIDLDGEIRAKRKELSELDAQYLSKLSEQGKKGYDEEQLWKGRITALTTEVDALESRRRAALVPLQKREEEVKTRESVLLKREETIALKETDLEETRHLLEDKLDTVSEREEEANKYALTLNNREFAVGLKEEQVRQRMAALTEILRQSLEDIETAKAEAARRKAILKGRDVSITEREKYVEIQEASYANREKAIADKYATLQRTITEINLTNDNGKRNP